ncbi:hypothetical protein FRC02_012003 [Tulasnella sp. 418]|nr:hypothetical protein FRC02_012003 [Tulasnella sp. 418]
MNVHISSLSCLTPTQLHALKKGGFVTLGDLLLPPSSDIARKAKISLEDVQAIIGSVSASIAPQPQLLKTFDKGEIFTAGDQGLDNLLEGGIRVGIITELVGEGASGKTQLALQLSLTVQLPYEQGGLGGSAIYLTTSSTLATSRLQQLIEEHPQLSPDFCRLDRIQTTQLSLPKALIFYLGQTIPTMINDASLGSTPIKLLVIDSLASLFRTTQKMTSAILFERSKLLNEISSLLHSLGNKHRLAIVVVNDVTDVFTNDNPTTSRNKDEVLYKEQARWFGQPALSYSNETKAAGLGLVWANQVSARIFLTRSGRRKVLEDQAGKATASSASDDYERDTKRQRTDTGVYSVQSNQGGETSSIVKPPTLIRRLDIIYSSFTEPKSVDFIITQSGFQTIKDSVKKTADLMYFGGNVDVGALEVDKSSESTADPIPDDVYEDPILDELYKNNEIEFLEV